MFNIKEMSREIASYISSNSRLRGITFSKIEEKDLVSFTSDELVDVFLQGFGGDYESSISYTYSKGFGLEVEVYISNNKARRIGNNLVSIIRREMMDGYPLNLSTTRYVPNDTSMSFNIGIPYSSINNTRTALDILTNLISCIAIELAKY